MTRTAMVSIGAVLVCASLLGPGCGGGVNELELGPMALPWADHGEAVALADFAVPGAWEDIEVSRRVDKPPPAWEEECVALDEVRRDQPLSYAVVQVTPDGIRVSGHPVVDLDEGHVDDGLKRGTMISPLYDTLQALADSAKASAATHSCPSDQFPGSFSGKLLLAVDARVPFSTLREVMYTCGQAQFGEFYFLVDDPETGEQVEWTAGRRGGFPPLMLTIAINGAGFVVAGNDDVVLPPEETRDWNTPRQPTLPCTGGCGSVEDYDWTGLQRILVQLKERHPAEANAIVIPDPGVGADVLIRSMDTCQWDDTGRSLFPYVVVAGGVNGHGSHVSPPSTGSGRQQTLQLDLHSTVAAIASSLPAIGAPRASSDFLDAFAPEEVVVVHGSAAEARAKHGAGRMEQGLAALIGTTGEGSSGDAVADLLINHNDGGGMDADLDSMLSPATNVHGRSAGRRSSRDPIESRPAPVDEPPPPPQASLRSWFPETFAFEPLVITDADGLASVDVTVPDQLTTWRVLGLAHDQAGSQAGDLHTFSSTLPAYVEVTPPEVLRVGDRLRLPLQVVNNSADPYQGRLQARAIGDSARGQTSASVDLTAYASDVRTLPLDAVSPGVATVVATLGGEDAVQRSLRIVPAGRPEARSTGGTLAAPRSVELPAPDGSDPASATLELVVYPGPLAVVRAEMEQAPARGGDLAAVAYTTALVGRGQQVAARMQVEVDPDQLRTDRLRAYQQLVRHTRAPSTAQALLALRGAAQLDDPMTRALSTRLATPLADAQSPDGSFAVAWGTGEVSLERALVFTAEASSACDELDDRVARRAATFVARNAPAVKDPYTASVLLGANLVAEPQRAALREQILDAVVEREDGSRVVRPTEASQREDGSRPGELETTARAIVALQDDGESRELLADLATAVLSSYRRGSGFGDGRAGLATLEALAVMFDEPLPDQVQVRLLDGETELVAQDLDLSAGVKPLVVSLAAPRTDAPLRLEASPAVPGLVYTLTRTDWLDWDEPSADGFGLRVTVPDRLRVGRSADLQLQAAVPGDEPFVITLELPAGLELDEHALDELDSSGAITRYEARPGRITLHAPGQPAGASFGLQLEVIPTLAGTLQWGAATLALRNDPQRQVQIQPAALRVSP